MESLIKYIPWSGVGFIFLSVTLFAFWSKHREISTHDILLIEAALFVCCLYLMDKESRRK